MGLFTAIIWYNILVALGQLEELPAWFAIVAGIDIWYVELVTSACPLIVLFLNKRRMSALSFQEEAYE